MHWQWQQILAHYYNVIVHISYHFLKSSDQRLLSQDKNQRDFGMLHHIDPRRKTNRSIDLNKMEYLL